jgi:FkbM family methyltransferase
MSDAAGPSANHHLHRLLMKVRPAPLAAFVKKLMNVQRIEVTTKHGIYWLDPVSLIGRDIIDKGEFEPEITERIQGMLSAGNVFVDLGANEGYFTIIAARLVGPTGRVLAIEPQDRLAPVIRRNAELNGLTNITLERSLVSDKSGTAKLALAPDTNPGSSGITNATKYPVAWQAAQADTLENIIDRHKIHEIDCIKIDIEGSEYEAVTGSKPLFKSGRIKSIVIEIHHDALAKRGLDASRILEALKGSGYDVAWGIEDHYFALTRRTEAASAER